MSTKDEFSKIISCDADADNPSAYPPEDDQLIGSGRPDDPSEE